MRVQIEANKIRINFMTPLGIQIVDFNILHVLVIERIVDSRFVTISGIWHWYCSNIYIDTANTISR